MKILSADDVARFGDYKAMIEALRSAFKAGAETPVRHHHHTQDFILLLMPAWNAKFTGLKTVTVRPKNAGTPIPTVQASYLLIENATGQTLAMLDGTELTRRRTAAASALAADYLARKDAETLLIVGAGALAPHFAKAHAAIRNLKKIMIYNRSAEKAQHVAKDIVADGYAAVPVENLAAACKESDIISGITSAAAPVILGEFVKPGTHIDIAGAFTPQMRETDGALIAKSRVFVDTLDGAKAEAGDLIQAAAEGHFRFENIQADLFELCRAEKLGRGAPSEITLFKSSGTAIEDLAAAEMIYLQSAKK